MKDDMKWIAKDHSKSLFECKTCGQKTLSFKDFAPPRFIMQIYQIWDELDVDGTKIGFDKDKFDQTMESMNSVLNRKQVEEFAVCLHLMLNHNVATSRDKRCYNCLIDMGRTKLHLTDDKKFTNFVFFMLLDLEMVKIYESESPNSKRHPGSWNPMEKQKFRALDWKEQLEIIHAMRDYYSDINASWFREAGYNERMVSVLPSLLTVIDYISDDIEFNVTDMKKEWGTV